MIQNSGHFSTLESTGGSIRIESEADVEAVNVVCKDTCFVQGTLTAWKVVARAIHLEDTARANIVLQETEQLRVGQEARLVGNFSSEKDLFLLFSRFAGELRQLPLFAERRGPDALEGEQAPEMLLGGVPEANGDLAAAALEAEDAEPAKPGELPDPLFFSLVILEREFARPAYGPTSQRVIEELIKLLRERDLETLGLTYRTLFGRIVEPGKDLQRVFDLIGGYFKSR